MTKISTDEIDRLITAHLLGTISAGQRAILLRWREASPANDAFFKHICSSYRFQAYYRATKEIDYEEAMNSFAAKHQVHKTGYYLFKNYLRYAAVFLLLLSAGWGGYYFLKQKPEAATIAAAQVQPGSAKAILILDDGSKMTLNNGASQTIRSGANAVATNTNQGIAYNANGTSENVKFNTLMIPRGGEYRITLADGTKVHLNSASELRYPVSFDSQSSRDVYLKGEGYFEVAKNKKSAFIVHVGDLQVKQYGTAFNINAHSAGSIKVVLVHGSIGVKNRFDEHEQRLKVSQLAEYKSSDKSIAIRTVDVEPYVAWNQGMFNFENENLADIMETLSLWYDVDVQFNKDELRNLRFTGSLNRSIPINGILKAIQSTTDVKIALNGHKILIYK